MTFSFRPSCSLSPSPASSGSATASAIVAAFAPVCDTRTAERLTMRDLLLVVLVAAIVATATGVLTYLRGYKRGWIDGRAQGFYNNPETMPCLTSDATRRTP